MIQHCPGKFYQWFCYESSTVYPFPFFIFIVDFATTISIGNRRSSRMIRKRPKKDEMEGEEEEVESSSGDSSYDEENDDVESIDEVPGNLGQGVLPSTPVAKGIMSTEYDTPIVALLEGKSLKKKKKKKTSNYNNNNIILNEGKCVDSLLSFCFVDVAV
jgi:hypothetical protein